MGLAYNANAHAGIARRAGRSPSEARKLPEQKPRSPRGMSETGKPKRGASGGMQGGPRRGRSPITGPALPPPEAAQTTIKKSPRARRAQKLTLEGQSLLYFLQSARRAYSPPCRAPRRRPKLCRKAKPRARRAAKENVNPTRRTATHLAARRAGVPNFAGWRNPVPEGQRNHT